MYDLPTLSILQVVRAAGEFVGRRRTPAHLFTRLARHRLVRAVKTWGEVYGLGDGYVFVAEVQMLDDDRGSHWETVVIPIDRPPDK